MVLLKLLKQSSDKETKASKYNYNKYGAEERAAIIQLIFELIKSKSLNYRQVREI